jgi:flagellar biosynthesis/type III secretory pathway chaperone
MSNKEIKDIIFSDVLHPSAHGSHKSCLDDNGNAYDDSNIEPWGVIPLVANIKGIRYSMSFTPIVKHENTVPYKILYEDMENSDGSYSDIYKNQPNNIRWTFDLDGINPYDGKCLLWESKIDKLRDAIALLDEDGDISSLIESMLLEIQSKLNSMSIPSSKAKEILDNVLVYLTTNIDAKKKTLSTLSTLLDEYEIKLEDEDEDEDEDISEEKEKLLHGLVILGEKIAKILYGAVEDLVSCYEYASDVEGIGNVISGIKESDFNSDIEDIKEKIDELTSETVKIIKLDYNQSISGLFVSYINEYTSKCGFIDCETEDGGFNWGFRQKLEHVFEQGDDSDCQKLSVFTGDSGKTPKPKETIDGSEFPTFSDSDFVQDIVTSRTIDGKAYNLVGKEYTNNGWTFRSLDSDNNTEDIIVYYEWEDTSGGKYIYFANHSKTSSQSKSYYVSSNGSILEWEYKDASFDTSDSSSDCMFVIQMIKRKSTRSAKNAALTCVELDELNWKYYLDDCYCTDSSYSTSVSKEISIITPENPFIYNYDDPLVNSILQGWDDNFTLSDDSNKFNINAGCESCGGQDLTFTITTDGIVLEDDCISSTESFSIQWSELPSQLPNGTFTLEQDLGNPCLYTKSIACTGSVELSCDCTGATQECDIVSFDILLTVGENGAYELVFQYSHNHHIAQQSHPLQHPQFFLCL